MKKKFAAALCACLLVGTVAFATVPASVELGQPVSYTSENGSSLSIDRPVVSIEGNEEATQKINVYFAAEADKAYAFYQNQLEKGGVVTQKKTYSVSYNDGRYLSIIEEGSVRLGKEKFPTYWKTGHTFDVATGELVPWQNVIQPKDSKAFTVKNINQRLFLSKYKLSQYFDGLTELPKNYYLDKSGTVHFLFGLYEVAPYGTGIVDIDMGKKVR